MLGKGTPVLGPTGGVVPFERIELEQKNKSVPVSNLSRFQRQRRGQRRLRSANLRFWP
jgi:hypothetical protein